MAERVVVAMSGGVDSSLAAALLVEQGYDVVGVSMRLWSGASDSGCCSLDDFLDARLVAEQLGIPFYVMDFRAEFQRAVVDEFVAEYGRGRTPNPCARCNQYVKFAGFWQRARELGATRVATGHYARVEPRDDGAALLRGRDADKDQSYFLFGMERAALAHTLFPVGGLAKPAVRAAAEQRGLPVAHKRDSQEICFVPKGEHAAFVAAHGGSAPRPGLLIDGAGRALGQHDGVHHFTVGQRHGLGLGGGEPRYVTAIDAASGTVQVGAADDVFSSGVVADGVNWLAPIPSAGARVSLRIRSRFAPQAARIEHADAGGFVVRAEAGLRAVTPGQAAVLYDGERVLGGGWIRTALRDTAANGAGEAAAWTA
ncbi:MAG: tRNA 2-thiouridine(34) synthase MnmA [Deltaproteobacteria bacterium]|nr:tRNA 2-thiouridine(34) synthase MnmA [Deltaproteobacteria bacterium]